MNLLSHWVHPLHMFILLSLTLKIGSLPSIIRIGAIFNENEEEQETAFRFAIERINDDATVLPNATLVAHVERVPFSDSFNTEKKLCSLLNSGVAGIIGPTSEISTMHIRSICDSLEIPHLEVHYDIEARSDALTINLYPRPEVLSRAFSDLNRALGWEDFAIVYDYNEEVLLFSSVLQQARERGWNVQLYQLSHNQPFRETFWQVQADGKNNIVLDVKQHNLRQALRHAQQVGLMTSSQSFIITSLDFASEDLEDYRYSGAKMFSYRMVEDTNPELVTLLNDWSILAEKTGKVNIPPPTLVKTESALIYDSVKLLAMALGNLDKSQSVEVRPVSCIDEVPWIHGTSLVNYMRPIVFRGISGIVSLNEFGQRSNFNLNLFTLDKSIIYQIGTWNSKFGLNLTAEWFDAYSEYAIQQKSWIVTTVETQPYTMKRISSSPTKGNARFEGYVIDLIDELSLLLNFKYEIRLCKDGKYGAEEPDGTWNGMIGELLREEADLAVVDLTITRKRERVVDFTLPFMTTGVSILFLKPSKAESSFFGFLAPFTNTVWIYLLLASSLISLLLFICGRLSPYEWDNPFPCKEDQPILINECSVKNSFWFTVGSLMQQGSDFAPKAMSTRIIGIVWYFFTLIIVASYTANLAAFLTVEVVTYPFKDYMDLAKQDKIGYGCGASGSTRVSFRDSTDPYLKKISDFMEANPSMFVNNNEEGKDRVLKGNYAFFMEAAAIEYAVERVCNFTQIGGLLDNKGYGIATRKDSPIRHALSRGILKLQEKGKLHILYERWWKQKRGGGACQALGGGGASAMTIANVGGVFVVLGAGGIFAVLMAVVEFCYKHYKLAPDTETMGRNMKADASFAFRLHEYTKPNRRSKSTCSLRSKNNSESGHTLQHIQ